MQQTTELTEIMEIKKGSWFIIIQNQHLYIEYGQQWRLLKGSELTHLTIAHDDYHYLGTYDDESCYIINLRTQISEENLIHPRTVLTLATQLEIDLISRALQLMTWKNQHQYCGQCGRKTTPHRTESAFHCEPCELFFYPRISPCMMCLVTKGDYCLLAQHQKHPNGFYATLAGFVEAGESVEQTLHREVMEEVGLTVDNLSYFNSQSWPFPQQLMIGFFAEYRAGDIRLEEQEIIDAQWFHYDNLPDIPPEESLSGKMIRHFVQQRKS